MNKYSNELNIIEINRIFENNDPGFIEDLAVNARLLTEQYFGRTITLYSPLYISNYCENNCLYCGFASRHHLRRKRLSQQEINEECKALAINGIQSILILTGESREYSPPEYIMGSILTAKKYFPNISLEVYPLSLDEYRDLYAAGIDGVTIFQETYNKKRYAELHPSGRKRDYEYRYNTPERIAESGIRRISLGALLGLSDWKKDAISLFRHLRYLEKKYPGIEYSLCFPRIQVLKNSTEDFAEVSDTDMIKIICAARLLFPRIGINLSTRESAKFRDNIIGIGVTHISAGSCTSVGGYAYTWARHKNSQFETSDKRSVQAIKKMLVDKGFDPVFTDWRRIENN